MAAGPGGNEVGRVSVRVVPDTSKFRQELLAQLKRIEKQLKVEIPVEFDTRGAIRSLGALQKRVGQLNQNLSINSNVKDLSRNLDRVGNSAGNAGGQILGMSRYMALGLGVMLLLAPALGLISALIAGLPSLLFIAAGAFAAIGLGMDGITKAAKVLKPAVDSIKETLSATFERTLTPVFEKLRGLFPFLEGGLARIAVGLSQMASSFVDVLTSAEGMTAIQTILFKTGKFFSQIAEIGVPQFTQALLTLGREGAKSFDLLAAGFNRFFTDFNKVVQNASDSGVLREAFVGLADVTNALLSMFNRLFAAGLQAMSVLGGPLTTLINGLTDILVALMPILSVISGLVANVLGTALSALAPIIQELLPLIEMIAAVLGTVLTEAIRILAPILLQLVGIIATSLISIMKVLQPLLPPLLAFVAQFAALLGDTLAQALILVTPFLQQLVQFAVSLITALLPLLPVIMELATVAFASMLDVLQQLMPDLMSLAAEVMPTILSVIKDLVPVIIELARAWADIIPYIADVVLILTDLLMPVIREMVRWWADAWDAVMDLFAGALQFLKGNLQFFIGLFTGDWEKMWEGIQNIAAGAWEMLKAGLALLFSAIDGMFFGLPSRILNTLGDLGSLLYNAGVSIIQGLIDGVKSMIQAAGNAAASAVSAIREFFPFSPAKKGPFSGKGYTLYSGMALMEDWAKGIQNGTPAAVSAIEEAMGQGQGALELNAMVQSEGFGGIGDRITEAMAGWTIEFDANGIARMVNKTNRRNERR